MSTEDLPPLPVRPGYGTGCYRRCIALEASGREVRGELADDFHHFAVRLRHDGVTVLELTGEDVRAPWTTCRGALVPLQRMEGAALSVPLLDLLRHTPSSEQCTHLHDLACLAIAHAARTEAGGAARRRYDVAMPDPVGRATRCTLARDGVERLAWPLAGTRIGDEAGGPFAGLAIGTSALYARLRDEPDADAVETAWILQRAVFIGLGRQHDFDRMRTAEAFVQVVGGACHTFHPERVAEAKRIQGTLRDFSEGAERILERPASPGREY